MAKQEQADSLQLLKASIKAGTPGNLYVFHGEETFLLNHYLQQLKKCLLDELTESFNYHKFNAETFDLMAFGDAVENLPMMAEHTLVQVEDIDLFKLNEEARDKLVDVLADIPEYCTVVFLYHTVAWKPDKRLKRLWEAISVGEIVAFSKQDQRSLITWIQRHFASHKKRIAPELCAYLIDITDGTMTSISGEIQKIVAYSGAEVICKSDIDAVTEPVLDAVVFRMTDQMSAGDYGGAMLTLQKLLKMQQEPLPILSAVGGHLRRINTARILLDHGKNHVELQKLYGITEYPAKKTIEAARRFRAEFCAKAMELVLETDYKMKTSFDEQERLLELLIFRLSQEAQNG